jgi:glycosyltransferase involved in cell wall biosynthesis
MKVLYWTPVFWPDIGGIELIAMRHLESLKARGHEFLVLAAHGRTPAADAGEFAGIPVYRFPMIPALQERNLPALLAIQKRIAALKRAFRPDVEHLNFGGPAPIGYFCLRAAGPSPAPLVVQMHASVQGLAGGADSITGQLLRRAAWTVACSDAVLEDARALEPALASRSSTLYYGVQDRGVPPAPRPAAPCVLCLGRLTREKGFDLAIRAFAQVAGHHPRARLLVAGDGPARGELEALAAELLPPCAVEFAGEVSPASVPAVINRATLMVVPSRWREAFGLVAVEAALQARPVVAARTAGLAEAVQDGHTGLLVPPEDVPALAAALGRLLAEPRIAAEMGRAGRVRAQALFGWPRYVDACEAVYRGQAGGASP